MSGQPNKNPSDADKFRQQYLANLDLRARLDDVNLQANKVYKRTGQLPVEPSDFRTTEEKLADIEKLKVEVRSKLSEITDGREANKIVQELSPKQMLFYAQSADAINKEIKPKYRMGIYAEIFEPFLVNYMNTTANVNGIQSGLQQTSGRNVELNTMDIVKAFPDVAFLQNFQKEAYGAYNGIVIKRLSAQFNQIIMGVMGIYSFLKSASTDLRSQGQLTIDADEVNKGYKLINDIGGELPTKVQLSRWLDSAYMFARAKDKAGMENHLVKGIELLTLQPETRELIQELELILMNLPVDEDEGKLVPGRSGSELKYPGDTPFPGNFNLFAKKDLIKFARDSGIRIGKAQEKGTKNALISYITQQYTPDMSERADVKSMEGTGIRRVKPKPVAVKPSVDWFGGINPTPRFVPFGKYIINKHRLENNIIAVKRPAGSSIKEFPSERVSRRLGGIIRGITNNEMPDFDDLSELDDTEKVYLNKLADKSNLKDRLILPAPKKSEIDKEIDEFEIMKGQIMSGNDNKDLVRKFKSTLMKLSNKGVIPKSQVKELLLELTEMGF